VVRHQSLDVCTNFPIARARNLIDSPDVFKLTLHCVTPSARRVGPLTTYKWIHGGKSRSRSKGNCGSQGNCDSHASHASHATEPPNEALPSSSSTQALTCRPILSRHFASMLQDGLQIAGPLGGGGGVPPHTHTHPYPHPNLSDWPVG